MIDPGRRPQEKRHFSDSGNLDGQPDNESETGPALTGMESDRHADIEGSSPIRAGSTHSNRFKQTPRWH